jgi:predicted ribosome quality control (RQC) complex YloA/Tae2 family protein
MLSVVIMVLASSPDPSAPRRRAERERAFWKIVSFVNVHPANGRPPVIFFIVHRNGKNVNTMMNDSTTVNQADQLRSLRKQLGKSLTHATRKLEKQREELEESHRATWYRQIADSLMATAVTVPRGTAKTTVFNVHTQTEETVALNPKLDMKKNAELLYKKSRKAHHGNEINEKKVADTEIEVKNFEKIIGETDSALSSADDAAIADLCGRIAALIDPHPAAAASSPGAPAHENAKVPYRHYVLDEWNIYIGKNDEQNDELTVRFAKPRDLWLHVAGHAGSHIVIRRPDKTLEVPREVIEKVAALAVWFSKAKHTSYAEVHVTEARFVHKRRHSPAGQVIAERCKGIRVSPKSPHDLFPSQYDTNEE